WLSRIIADWHYFCDCLDALYWPDHCSGTDDGGKCCNFEDWSCIAAGLLAGPGSAIPALGAWTQLVESFAQSVEAAPGENRDWHGYSDDCARGSRFLQYADLPQPVFQPGNQRLTLSR